MTDGDFLLLDYLEQIRVYREWLQLQDLMHHYGIASMEELDRWLSRSQRQAKLLTKFTVGDLATKEETQ